MSRCHATIKYVDGEYYLNDNTSKFGTLVIAKEKVLLDPEAPLTVQAGRTLLDFRLIGEVEKWSGCIPAKKAEAAEPEKAKRAPTVAV